MSDKLNELMIIGIVLLILALLTAGFNFFRFSSMDPVQATYTEHNCHLVEQGKTECDLTISYNYNGKDYEHTIERASAATLKPDTRYVDPEEPDVSNENHTLYILAVIMAAFGILFGVGAFYSAKKS